MAEKGSPFSNPSAKSTEPTSAVANRLLPWDGLVPSAAHTHPNSPVHVSNPDLPASMSTKDEGPGDAPDLDSAAGTRVPTLAREERKRRSVAAETTLGLQPPHHLNLCQRQASHQGGSARSPGAELNQKAVIKHLRACRAVLGTQGENCNRDAPAPRFRSGKGGS